MLQSLFSNTPYNHGDGVKVIGEVEHILTLKTRRQCILAHRLMTHAGWVDFVSM